MDMRNVIVAVGATPIMQAILNAVGYLNLEPLKHWGWKGELVLPITYVIATSAAAIACLLPARANRTKIIYIVVAAVALLGCFGTYSWTSSSPPQRDWVWFYDLVGYCTYFLTYAAFGMVVARVIRYFGDAPKH